jgi:hypothetical protein
MVTGATLFYAHIGIVWANTAHVFGFTAAIANNIETGIARAVDCEWF